MPVGRVQCLKGLSYEQTWSHSQGGTKELDIFDLSYLGKLSTSKETGVDRCSYQDIQGKESSDPSGKIQEVFLGEVIFGNF